MKLKTGNKREEHHKLALNVREGNQEVERSRI